MEYTDKSYCLEVWGDYACFTRPEMKVERVSYDVMTPSSARSIFEAIFWKPAVRWRVTRIEVLNPIHWISVRRNEVGSLMSHQSKEIFIEEKRQQRAGLFLRDVRYRIWAVMEFVPMRKREVGATAMRQDENPAKYQAMFERRAEKGQCFNQPYLGCREFSAHFEWIQEATEGEGADLNRDLGFMLHDLDFSNPKDPQPLFFRAALERGVVHVPPLNSEEVRR